MNKKKNLIQYYNKINETDKYHRSRLNFKKVNVGETMFLFS
jgi:hypothetical protein